MKFKLSDCCDEFATDISNTLCLNFDTEFLLQYSNLTVASLNLESIHFLNGSSSRKNVKGKHQNGIARTKSR